MLAGDLFFEHAPERKLGGCAKLLRELEAGGLENLERSSVLLIEAGIVFGELLDQIRKDDFGDVLAAARQKCSSP